MKSSESFLFWNRPLKIWSTTVLILIICGMGALSIWSGALDHLWQLTLLVLATLISISSICSVSQIKYTKVFFYATIFINAVIIAFNLISRML